MPSLPREIDGEIHGGGGGGGRSDVIKLYYTWSCPFCQPAWITLNHFQLSHELIEVYEEHEEGEGFQRLIKINPHETVPTLSVNEHIITDCVDAITFLNNYSGTDPNFVTDTLLKDAYRIHQKLVATYFSVFTKASQREGDKVWLQFEAALSMFAIHIQDGGYFKSPTMNIVDVIVFPFVVRLSLMKIFRGRELDTSLPWVQTLIGWRDQMLRKEEVWVTVGREEDLVDGWRSVLEKIGVRI